MTLAIAPAKIVILLYGILSVGANPYTKIYTGMITAPAPSPPAFANILTNTIIIEPSHSLGLSKVKGFLIQ